MNHPMDVGPLSRGVMLPCGATPICPMTGQPSLLPSSCARTPVGTSCDAPTRPSGEIRGFHVPLTYHLDDVGTRLSAGGPLVCARTGKRSWTDHAPFGSSLSASDVWNLTLVGA